MTDRSNKDFLLSCILLIMNIHYLFGKPFPVKTPYVDHLKELMAEAMPLEPSDLVKIKKTLQS